MKRRKAIQHIGWGLSGGILLPSMLNSCKKPDPGPEIVYSGQVAVIGAGAAGLYVADILHSKGINVTIFEARDQIGGRVRSLRNQPIEKYPSSPQMSSDFPIELGAETIIGPDSIFGKIYQDYNLPTTEYAAPPAYSGGFAWPYGASSANPGKIVGLKANPMQDALISRFSGVQPLVKLNTPITSVNHGGNPIILTAKDGATYEADKVIVTVPVSILKNGSLSFSPGLPGSFSGSLAKIGMGATLRVVIEFKRNFWGDTVTYILGSSNTPEYFSLGVGRSSFNRTLSVTITGEKAVQYSALGDKVIDTILAELDVMYAGQATLYIRQDLVTLENIYVMEDWTKMEYLLGAYSYPLAGASDNDRIAIGQPVNNKLFFAGEATDITGQAGMVNGALASAERVAQEIIEAIKAGL